MYDKELLKILEDLSPWEKLAMGLVLFAVKRDDWNLAVGLRDFAMDGEPGLGEQEVVIDHELLKRVGNICSPIERVLWGKLASWVSDRDQQIVMDRLQELMTFRVMN